MKVLDEMSREYWEQWGRDDFDGAPLVDWFESLSTEDKKQAVDLVNLIMDSEADPLDEDAAMIAKAIMQKGYRKSDSDATQCNQCKQFQKIKNSPLTIDELKALKVYDWVYIQRENHPTYRQKTGNSEDHFPVYLGDFMVDELPYSTYGTEWVAYKNKEETEISNYDRLQQIENLTKRLACYKCGRFSWDCLEENESICRTKEEAKDTATGIVNARYKKYVKIQPDKEGMNNEK